MFIIHCATLHNNQNTLMYKNESRTNLMPINRVIMVYELRTGTTRNQLKRIQSNSHRIQFWSWFNIPLRINCILIPYVNNEIKLGSVTYYPLYTNSSWIGVRNLVRSCYHLSRLPLKCLSYKFHLLCDQLAYFNSKEHMSNSIKRITTTLQISWSHVL